MMVGMIDGRTAERYRSLLLGDIEYLGQIIGAADPLEGSYGAHFLSHAQYEMDHLRGDANYFYEEASAPRFRY